MIDFEVRCVSMLGEPITVIGDCIPLLTYLVNFDIFQAGHFFYHVLCLATNWDHTLEIGPVLTANASSNSR